LNNTYLESFWLGSCAKLSKIDFDSLCISHHLSVIMDLLSIPSSESSLYLIMPIVSLALASTTYADSVTSVNHSLFMLWWLWFMLWESQSGLRLGVTCLFPRHDRLWLSLEVLLLWAHPTGTSYLSPLETVCQYHLIRPTSTKKLTIYQWRHWPGSGAPLIQVALY